VRSSLLRKNNIKKAIFGTSLFSAAILIIVLTDPPIIYGLENSNDPFSSQKILTV
jgi:hypothetical protein